MKAKVLVSGWYHHNNLGDDLFMDAFKKIFPDFQFTFVDHIKPHHLKDIDAVFFGGGSFLGEALKISESAYPELKIKKIFYIGVGAETSLSEKHQELVAKAELVAVRTDQKIDNFRALNKNVLVIPDLVYSLEPKQFSAKEENSILVIPNISVVPKWTEPHWRHAAWSYFKIEFAQMLDFFLKKKFKINFMPLCENDHLNDSYAAGELVNLTSELGAKKVLAKPNDFDSAIATISQHQCVITQRFHGAILSRLAGVPSLTIHHHDKLKDVPGRLHNYYGVSKDSLIREVNNVLLNSIPVLPIDRDIYTELRERVEHALRRS